MVFYFTKIQELYLEVMAHIRQVDTLARIGGDEFVLLLPDIKNEDNAIQLAQLIIHLMAEEFSIEGKKHMITLRILTNVNGDSEGT